MRYHPVLFVIIFYEALKVKNRLMSAMSSRKMSCCGHNRKMSENFFMYYKMQPSRRRGATEPLKIASRTRPFWRVLVIFSFVYSHQLSANKRDGPVPSAHSIHRGCSESRALQAKDAMDRSADCGLRTSPLRLKPGRHVP